MELNIHNHPQREKELNLDKDHVIIDREVFDKLRELYFNFLLH